MKYEPHDYQKYATSFIENKAISAILLECGLGKSAITLTAIFNLLFDYFEIHKVLIIAPIRVALNTWPEELNKWDHLKDLRYSIAVGTEKQRVSALNTNADIYIINRENVEWLIEKSGIPFDFDMVVLDELSSFKNGRTKRFKSFLKVRPRIKWITGLTGTPAPNGLMDLWAQFRLLDKGDRLGRFITPFRETYFRPDKRNGDVIFSYKPLPWAEKEIYDKISDISISMKSVDYLKMPELISNEYKVYLSEDERNTYEDLKDNFTLDLKDGEITAANAASLTMKLSQMANGAIYDDSHKAIKIHDRKLDALEDLIEAANGKPVLVAYWFNHDLERIVERLEKLKINYSTLDSEASINAWNKGELEVGLIHPASAGHGLNLQSGGNTLIWFGLTWSLELYQQTIARLWRQGQKSETVVVEHIVADKTIDELILKALKRKDMTQEGLLSAVKAIIGGTFYEC